MFWFSKFILIEIASQGCEYYFINCKQHTFNLKKFKMCKKTKVDLIQAFHNNNSQCKYSMN